MPKNSHCSHCGAAFTQNQLWPRACSVCGEVTFLNPVPVTIVLLPVLLEEAEVGGAVGIVAVRRAIAPRKGELALPGGYVDYGETWQMAGAREMREEACIEIEPDQLHPIEVFSSPDGTLIVAGIVPPIWRGDLPGFRHNTESNERVILTQPEPMAFELHTELVTQYLAGESLGYSARKPHFAESDRMT